MRIVAVTFGTEGDSRPLVALCQGLRGAGHDVTLLAERGAAPIAQALDVPFRALAGDMAAELEAAAAGFENRGQDIAFVSRTLARIARGSTREWMQAVLEDAAGADAIICAGLAVYVGLSCAEKLSIAAIGAALQPVIPTTLFPSPFLPQWRLPGWANRLGHRLVLGLMWRAFRTAVNDARREIAGQAPRAAEWQGYPILFGMSPAIVPRPPDWPARFSVDGYWWPPPVPRWQPDDALRDFLAAGAPPVYIGFGSMLGFDRVRMLETIVEALSGRRAVISSGWGRLGERDLPANLLRVGFVPHEWLFPRMAVVVHHGGAGTTHAAARAGVPAVVVPFAGDQFFWADRLHRLGVAPPPLPRRHMSARSLRERIAAADSDGMHQRAAALCRSIERENGVAVSVARLGALTSEARFVPQHE